MKISKEVKIGAVSIIVIVLFIWLYSFLKGENLLTSTAHYYSVYDEISGLSESNPVEVSGYKVGVVQSIKFIDDGSGRLSVTLSLNKNMQIPVGSIAEITTATLIAGMKIQFVFSDSKDFYQNGDTIPGRVAESIFARLEDELLPLKTNISDMIINLNSVISAIDETLSPDFRQDLNETVSNLNSTTGTLAKTLKEREKELSETLANLHRFSEVIAANTPKIDTAINNLAMISDSLAKADFAGTINRLRDAAGQTAELLENLNKGEGSAGKLMTDDSLYINLSGSLASLEALLADMKENPKKYVHFSLFGKKQ
jgi:phospholipid/cholesterol/gamma-HCH transport system substrate-binding protein